MARITWDSFSPEAQAYAYSQAARKAAGKRITQYGEPEEFRNAYGYLLDHNPDVLEAVSKGNELFIAEHTTPAPTPEAKTYNPPAPSQSMPTLTIQPVTDARLIDVPNQFPTGGSIANIFAPVGSPAYNAAIGNANNFVASTGLTAADLYARAAALPKAPTINASNPPTQEINQALTNAGLIQANPYQDAINGVGTSITGSLFKGSIGIVLLGVAALYFLGRKR